MTDPLSVMTGLMRDPAAWSGHGLFKRSYALRSPAHTYALLQWDPGFKTRARAKTARAEWVLERRTFPYPRVIVREKGEEIATYFPGWMAGGRLKLKHRGSFRWRGLAPWRVKYGFLDDRGGRLVEFHARLKLPPAAEVTLGDRAFGLDELPLLVVVGWYVTILAFDDLAAGSVAALMRR